MSTTYDAFATQVAAFAALHGFPTAYPGIGFEPPNAGTWLEVKWFPNETVNYGLSDDGPSLHQGFGQVSVCYRPGAGIVGGAQIAEQVIAAFGKGTTLADARVYRKPWVSSVLEQPDRVSHPVTIPWRALKN